MTRPSLSREEAIRSLPKGACRQCVTWFRSAAGSDPDDPESWGHGQDPRCEKCVVNRVSALRKWWETVNWYVGTPLSISREEAIRLFPAARWCRKCAYWFQVAAGRDPEVSDSWANGQDPCCRCGGDRAVALRRWWDWGIRRAEDGSLVVPPDGLPTPGQPTPQFSVFWDGQRLGRISTEAPELIGANYYRATGLLIAEGDSSALRAVSRAKRDGLDAVNNAGFCMREYELMFHDAARDEMLARLYIPELQGRLLDFDLIAVEVHLEFEEY